MINFYVKLDKKYEKNSKKILVLEKINFKIEAINNRKNIFGFNINWNLLPELNDEKIDVIKSLKTDIIRFPWWSTSQYWDWEKWFSSKSRKYSVHKLDDLFIIFI